MCFSATLFNITETYSLWSRSRGGEAALISTTDGLSKLVLGYLLSEDKIPAGWQMEWGTFNFDSQARLIVQDQSPLTSRRWVAYKELDGSYAVALYDGRFQKHNFKQEGRF